MTKRERKPAVRKLSKILVLTAAVVLVLAGTVAADVAGIVKVLPQTMQEWLGQRWEDQGGALGNGQAEVIEEHVQTIGVSDTQSSVTITLDSATVSDNFLRVLLKIQGENLDEDCDLDELELRGMPFDEAAFLQGGYSVSRGETLEDGTLIRMVTFEYTLREGAAFSEGGNLELRVKNLREYPDTIVLKGEWVLPFTLEPLAKEEVLTVERAEVPKGKGQGVMESWDIQVGVMEIWNIQVFATGFSFQSKEGLTAEISLCLSDGMEVRAEQTSSFGTEPGIKTVQGVWSVPVDLSMAEALRFGSVVVPLE